MMLDFTPPKGFTLAAALPTRETMIKVGNQYITTCPECGGRLLIYEHEGLPAFLCWGCHFVWPTTAAPSWTSHERVLGRIVPLDQIILRQAKEAA